MPTQGVLDYEDITIMRPLVTALMASSKDGDIVIFRGPFRWKRATEGANPLTDASVICNGYEMFELEQIADENGWDIIYNFTHAAIVRKKEAAQ